MEAVKVKVVPQVVKVFPEQKSVYYLLVENVEVKLVDNGVKALCHLLDENNSLIESFQIQLTNDEVSEWTTTDEQLIGIILHKLNLVRNNN